ncbi:hypothetical protein PSACC_02991 [Paramicrosporidium saccamoebae]|uniref:Uncharacterized protein n=1 Tax=Paramicrosporidium saccamoebae TaxID=1246581 RepID=A0A2H9THF8_9FUNG|nr:hypothetical protein PSACC_02991 [Paramicrosporidium saccamoebae]
MVDESTGLMMNLKLEEAVPAVNLDDITDDCVPKIVRDANSLQALLVDELVYEDVFGLIDGQRTLRQIATTAHVNLDSVRKAICDLMYSHHCLLKILDHMGQLPVR